MVAYNKFNQFVEDLGLGEHVLTAAGDVLKVYLSNTTPDAAADVVKADLAEITAQNGYPAGGSDVQNTWSESAGTATLGGTDVVWTATAGGFGPGRYFPLYNDTNASPADPLIGWWDYGSAQTVNDGEDFTWDVLTSILTLA